MEKKIYKSLGLVILLFIISTSGFCQVIKYKSTTISGRYLKDNNTWSEWNSPEESSALITFDQTKDRITIYAKEENAYDIAKYEGKNTDEDGDESLTFFCVDKEGVTCRIKILRLNSQKGRLQMYLYYNNMSFVYNIYNLD